VVKGVLSCNPQYHICRALKLRVPLIIVPVCQAHGVRAAYLYVIVEAKHIGREQGGLSNQNKLVAILLLFIVQRIDCCHRVRIVQVHVKFSNALIHFNARRFALIPVVHHHRCKCFPIPPAAWTSVLDTFDSIQVGVDVCQIGLIDGDMPRNPWGDHQGLDWTFLRWGDFWAFLPIWHINFHLCGCRGSPCH
jgi:hypothetical protein